MKLEIACNSYQSCIHAQQGGADRIELFENLPEGGCTPSYGMIRRVKEKISLPVYMMIRPRGGDFVYSEDEFNIMKLDIEMAHSLQVDGIVFGILNEQADVDTRRCAELLSLWKHKPATFHRAFDRCLDLNRSMETLIELGFERVLSSGGKQNVSEGKEVLRELNSVYGEKIIVMPGAGVTSNNVNDLMKTVGASEVHATAKAIVKGFSQHFQDSYMESDVEEIRKLVEAIHS